MAEVYVGNLSPNTTTHFIERELQVYGQILSVKIRRSFAFVVFKDQRDAHFAIHSWNGKFNWRVEVSRNSVGAGSSVCSGCGGYGHFARNCSSEYAKDIKNKGVKQSHRGRTKKNQVASTSTWKPVPPPPPPWLELPEDITAKILHKLGTGELLRSAQKVCTSWRKICRDPAMWRVIDMWKFGDVHDIYGPEVFFRRAVDLSEGHVTEINIEDFGTGDLLEYIAERCGHLRSLRFALCYDLSFETLSKTKGFPLLEELQLQCTPVENNDIEAIGQYCPMLKTFALNGRGRPVTKCSKEALAIATFMPELHHLQLFGNEMTNDGLEAILNGCPKLESLDLRHCFNLNLEGELGKRCAQQIKILRLPHDPIDDYEWFGKIPHWARGDFYDAGSYYYDYDYGELDYDDYCDPFQFDCGIEDFFF